jgi:hypothetical protein
MSAIQPRASYDATDIVSVRNDEATTLSKGMVVKRGTAQDGALLFDAVTDEILGVMQNDTLAGKFGTAQKDGRAVVLYGATIAVGDRLMPHATNGKAIVWTAAGGANAAVLGIANSAGVDGDLGEVDLQLSVRQG